MSCPVCGGREIGKVGASQYYCWNCFIEFNEKQEAYDVAEDGSLVALAEDEFCFDSSSNMMMG